MKKQDSVKLSSGNKSDNCIELKKLRNGYVWIYVTNGETESEISVSLKGLKQIIKELEDNNEETK